MRTGRNVVGCLLATACWWSISTVSQAQDARPFGLSQRTPWTTSRVKGSPDPRPPLRVQRIWEGLTLKDPLYLAAEPGRDSFLVVETLGGGVGPGRLRRFANRADVSELQTILTLDRLIYGLTFHPKFAENGYVYLVTNGPSTAKNKQNRIARYSIGHESPHAIDPQSELVILEWDSNGHNGGELAFGPDGYLYCVTGDGTSDSDELLTGQGLDDYLAVMLRLDVDHPTPDRPYSVPADNPFVDVPDAKPEIWAFGFRNPWRMTFDRNTGVLWVTQNGQDLWEQVYRVQKGGNYGWSVQEGSHPFYIDRKRGPGPILAPAAEHHHLEARSLTGGVVYYGSALPDLRGAYIYGDYSTGKIWGLRHDGERATWHQELADTPLAIVGFAETPGGDLLVIDQHTGFYRLEVNPPPEPLPPPFPSRLSETGLFASVAGNQPAPGVIPYSVNVPLWSDGAAKERWLAVPGDATVDFVASGKSWKFPNETVLVKTFSLDLPAGRNTASRRIETRLLTQQEKEWVGYSYEWNDEQTDAVLVAAQGKDRTYQVRDPSQAGGVREQTWHFPSRAECMVCHSRAANFVLGLQTEQLNRDQAYAEATDNQLRTLAHIHLLKFPNEKLAQSAMSEPESAFGRFAELSEGKASLESRVRAYLHVNCANCHQWAGGGNSAIDLLSQTPLEKTKLIQERPLHDTLGISDPLLISPGDSARSVLRQRMSRRGRGQMPPLATTVVDADAVKLLDDWIQSLPQ